MIDYTADRRRIVRDRDIAKTRLTIGRAADNDLHLSDLAIEPQHARIEQTGASRIEVAATGTLGFALDGKSTDSASIDCRSGAELQFGGNRIAVSLDADGAVLLTVERIQSEAQSVDEERGFSLARVMPSRRLTAWLSAILILGLFLALPIISHVTRGPDPKVHVIGDASWTPGKLSLAHHALEQRCEACHVRPFESVRDSACLACHTDVHDHAPMARQAGARGDPPLFELFLQRVGRQFGKPGPGACVACHAEHQGAGRMEPAQQQFCAACHATLSERLTDTKLGNAGDFGTLHPQFKVQIVVDPTSRAMGRVSLDGHPRENGGLFFPHKLHLDPLGGAAKMASTVGAERGYGNRLLCKDCHHPTEDGVRFLPVRMERDCEVCHSLVYDRVGPTFRTLKHGNVAQMIADLSVARPSWPVTAARPRPGAYPARGDYYANFTPPGGGVLQKAFTRDGVCGECHTPVYSGGRISVMPVTQSARHMMKGWFDHQDHRQAKCTTCHAAEGSSSASDLLLPGIAQCRTCHMGEGSGAKVPSGCVMCHSYHPAATAPRKVKPDRS